MLRSARILRAARSNIALARVRADRLTPTFVANTHKDYCGLRFNGSLASLDVYKPRHIGPDGNEVAQMLEAIGHSSMKDFVAKTMPSDVLVERPLNIQPPQGFTESELIARLKEIAAKNKIVKSLIGRGYYGTILPTAIQRNLLENPNWYTSYTPYQPEISQGRLESLLNFQTVIKDLTGMDIANASLLDEATAASEAMVLSFGNSQRKKPRYLVDTNVLEQTVEVIKSRADGLGIVVEQTDLDIFSSEEFPDDVCGVLASTPGANGELKDFSELAKKVHSKKAMIAVSSDLLALTLIEPPKYADIVVGSAQRFGVPMGYGGPHAGFFATKDAFKRKLPGRIIGASKDRLGDTAYRLTLQTREQHIRRDKATSNICTAQALLANISAMYAVYHGPEGLKRIAQRVHNLTSALAAVVGNDRIVNKTYFDTLTINVGDARAFQKEALDAGFNIWVASPSTISVSLDESITGAEFIRLCALFGGKPLETTSSTEGIPSPRHTPFLTQAVFNQHHSETELMRYMSQLQSKDLSLAQAMIPLGSCTMKLNAATAMVAITWPEFTEIHPFVPKDQAGGYHELIKELEDDLADITGFDATSLQPNSGAQGEYSGLRAIRGYLTAIGQGDRDVCLIPVSAHGTNPASAAVSGMRIVPVKCQNNGELDISDLRAKAEKHSEKLAAFMVTYPSTYGVYEPAIREAIEIVHANGGQVYMDGANMNAQVGLTSPADLGADVCHLNLHKTFCIPHGGGGPGVGPICVKKHLEPYLPGHEIIPVNGKAEGAVSAAPYGSALILPIPWAYIKMMGNALKESSEIAMLNANYMMNKLSPHYKVAFTNSQGRCAHEFILDIRPFKAIGVEAIDIAKRLQDYGFHAPTMSWPVANTLMIEPTESESKHELDRFIEALVSIRKEIAAIESGEKPYENGVLANAPHPAKDLIVGEWDRPYTRAEAAYPVSSLLKNKFWPAVARVDDAYGDKHLVCTCGEVENYVE